MNGKVKEIFRSLFFASVNMKGIIIEVLEIMLSIGAIIIFSFSKKESWVYWLVFFLGIFLLVLIFIKDIYPILVSFFYCSALCKSKTPIEMAFYIDCLSVNIGEIEVWTFAYEDLEEVSIVPKETWLIFTKRRAVLLPERSFALDQQKGILDYLREKRPEVEFTYKIR